MSYDDCYDEYDDEFDDEYDEDCEDKLDDEDELENDPTCSDHYKEMTLDAAAERYAEGKELFDDELAMYYADRASFLDDMDRSSSDGWFYGDDF